VKAYPQFRSSYSHEEMVEHFLLTPAELQQVLTCRGDAVQAYVGGCLDLEQSDTIHRLLPTGPLNR
jgi:hypothetical protein